MSDVTYREATRSDIARIVSFQLAMAEETEQLQLDLQACLRGVGAVFDDPALGRYYAAEAKGIVVASALITYEWSDWRNGVVWWIQSVYVLPEARKRKIFTGLYSYLQNLARADHDVRGIRLYVDRRNAQAQQVYVKLGMNGDHYQVFEWMKEF